MWKFLFVMALPLVALTAAHGSAEQVSMQAKAAADVECLIRTRPVSGGIELEGVVASRMALSGTYEFDVRKAGRAGTSSSAQSGDFDAVSGEAVVGHVGLGLEPGATYDAELVVRWNDHEAKCVASGPQA
jgi:hypothetical protein